MLLINILAKDCRQRRPGEIWAKPKNTNSKEIDQEYDAFLNDMGVKNARNEFDSVPSISGGIGGGSKLGTVIIIEV